MIPAPWKALLQSRKFWVAVIGVVMGVVLFVQGSLTADQLANLIVTLAGIVIAAIAVEDAAAKHGGGSA